MTSPAELMTIDAGLVGIEYASDLTVAGFQVSVVALKQQPLALLLPPPSGQLLQQQLSVLGVEFYWGPALIDAQHQLKVTLADGRHPPHRRAN